MLQRLQAEIQHPLRLAFHARDILDNFAAQTLLGFEHIIIVTVMKTIFVIADFFKNFCIFTHIVSSVIALHHRFLMKICIKANLRPATVKITLGSCFLILLAHPVVTLLFEVQSQVGAAGFDNPAAQHHMDEIRLDIIQQALVMRDDQHAQVRAQSGR